MAKKAEENKQDILKKFVKSKALVFGTEQTMKKIKAGKIEKVFAASNCPEETVESLAAYQKSYGFEFVSVGITNKDLGTFCKKRFPVSVIGLLKGA